MSGRRSRSKGVRGELEFVKLAKECGFPDARRVSPLQTGHVGRLPDVELSRDDVFWVEVKRGKRPNIRAALCQAIEESEGTGRVPVAAVRDDGYQWLVAMDGEDFLDMVLELQNSRRR